MHIVFGQSKKNSMFDQPYRKKCQPLSQANIVKTIVKYTFKLCAFGIVIVHIFLYIVTQNLNSSTSTKNYMHPIFTIHHLISDFTPNKKIEHN
jgi:hypothetical protein